MENQIFLVDLTIASKETSILFNSRLDGHEQSKDHAELLSKISNSLMNTFGIVACLIGIERIQVLNHCTGMPLHYGFLQEY